MIVIVAGLSGVTDIAALMALFGINASMILFGWLMETTNTPGAPVSWVPFGFGRPRSQHAQPSGPWIKCHAIRDARPRCPEPWANSLPAALSLSR